MKAQDVKCKCSGNAELHGSDHCNDEGPWRIVCDACGEESNIYAYPREAWANWKHLMEPN